MLNEWSLNIPNNKIIKFKYDVKNLNKHRSDMNNFINKQTSMIKILFI